MKIACPKCGREYRLDPSRIPAKGARFTCWGCQAKVEVRPLQAGQNEATVTESPSSKDLKEHKQTVDEAKATSSPPTATSSQSDSKSEDESFFTGPGIKKSTVNKTDSEPMREPTSAAKTAPLLPSKLQTSPNPSAEAGLTGALVGAGLTGTLKAQPLKITCPKCQHVYRIDPSRIPGGGGKFTCRNCQARIEVRPNQKAEEKSPETVQKGTSRYQTPPISQPTIPNAGLVANVTDTKPATEEELNKPGPITGPFSFKPPIKEEEPKEETPSQSVFDGESTMVMGSPPSQINKAMEEAQAKADEEASKKDFGFAFTDPSNEIKEPIKPPTFDFSDLSKPKEISFDLPTSPKKVEANFNFLDPKAEKLPEEPKEKFNFTDDSTPVARGATRKDSGELPNTETASSDTKRDLTDPLDPLSEVNSTLAMTNADIASVIESRTKEKSEKAEKKLTIPTPPVFEFDLNLPETKPKSEISSGLSQASEDLNATVAVEAGKPSWQTDTKEKAETKKEQSDNIFDLKTVVSMPAPIPLTKQASEVDDNKTKQLSSASTFKLEEKEQPSNPFTFTPPPVPPTLEKPGANLVKESVKGEEKPPNASPFSLTKGEEEKKAEPKIPPPPSLKAKTEPPVVKEDKPVAEIPVFKPPKVDLP
ncbi:MAG: zinc-ribbon domain-containing protein, partial [Blastocatellia bacterium]